jgi:hypothetical protein
MRQPPVAALLLGLALAAGARAELQTTEEIRECVRRNQSHQSSVGTILLKSKDRMGATTESRATIHWKRFDNDLSRVHLRFSDPPDLRGSALLLIEKEGHNDMFMYLPELKKVRRVTGHMISGSMFGTDFSYEQFERLQGMAGDVVSQRLADAEEQGRAVFVVAHTPNQQESQFEKVVSYIDKETCVPLRTDYFERAARLRKVLSADASKVEKSGDAWIPRELRMLDLRDETETALIVEEIEMGAEISRKIFSERNLAQGR